MAGLLGVMTAVLAVLFVLAPVEQRVVTYSWNVEEGLGGTAVPLSAYRPVSLTATVGCAQVRAIGPSGTLFSTVAGAATVPPADGLWIGKTGGRLGVVLNGTAMLSGSATDVPCDVTVTTDTGASSVTSGSVVLARWAGDHRPDVTGFFSGLAPSVPRVGLSAELQADTRFETSPSLLKIGLGVLALGCLAGSVTAVGRGDRMACAGRLRPASANRLVAWPIDMAVFGGLTVWTVIGPTGVDDGYTTAMVADAARSGYVGGYHHWLNSPEAPFGSFYEVFRIWSRVSTELFWLRIPALVLGTAAWLLVSRFVLPRVLPAWSARPWTGWLLAATFLCAWLPYCVGLRSEPYVVVGALATWCLVERSLITSRLLPLVGAVFVAGLTTTVAPTGLFAPLAVLVAAVPLWRVLRSRSDWRLWSFVAVLAGCGLVVLLVMFADQTPAAVVAGTEVRRAIGPDLPWYQEPSRYERLLLSRPDVEGSFGRRIPVLLILLGILVHAGTRLCGHRATRPSQPIADRFVAMTAAGFLVLVLTPTKWTHHFGIFAGHAAVLVVLMASTAHRTVRSSGARALLLAAIAATAALALRGAVTWWLTSNEGVSWWDRPPQLLGVAMWKPALAVAGLCCLVAMAQAWPRARRGRAGWPLPSVAATLLVFLGGGLAVQTYGLVHAVVARDGYTVGRDVLASLAGHRCGLAGAIQIEPAPAEGVLPVAAGAAGAADVRGAFRSAARPGLPELQGWSVVDGTAGRLVTGWYPLPPAAVEGTLPVVINVGGTRDGNVLAEFGLDGSGLEPTTEVPLAISSKASDIRLSVPKVAPGATAVRLRAAVAAGPAASWLEVSAPRVPRLAPLSSVYPADTPALLDWPVAPLMPCQRIATLAGGLAEMPAFILTAGRSEAEATARSAGGPFAAITDLAEIRPVPTYVDGAPTTWSPQVFAVVPRGPQHTPPTTGSRIERRTAWE